MKTFLIAVAVGATALVASQAQAADTLRTTTEFYADEAPVVENVRMVCNEFGRCWHEPRRRTVIIDDSYNAPRERYIERRITMIDATTTIDPPPVSAFMRRA